MSTIYGYVTPFDGRRWRVSFDVPDEHGAVVVGAVTENFALKIMAVLWAATKAKELHARTGGTVSVRIQKTNGQWQEERTYPKSRDPVETVG